MGLELLDPEHEIPVALLRRLVEAAGEHEDPRQQRDPCPCRRMAASARLARGSATSGAGSRHDTTCGGRPRS
jgi:hypothetical protein